MTATWRKQPPIPSRYNKGAFIPEKREHTCKECSVIISPAFIYCWYHLPDNEKNKILYGSKSKKKNKIPPKKLTIEEKISLSSIQSMNAGGQYSRGQREKNWLKNIDWE